MCVMSMVMDSKTWEWGQRYWPPPQPAPLTVPVPVPCPLPVPVPWAPLPTQQEVDEFRRLLERAREYDRKNGEPDCELAEKRQKLRDMAEKLGVKIDFV